MGLLTSLRVVEIPTVENLVGECCLVALRRMYVLGRSPAFVQGEDSVIGRKIDLIFCATHSSIASYGVFS